MFFSASRNDGPYPLSSALDGLTTAGAIFSSCSRSSRSRGRVHSPSHGPIPMCNAASAVLLLPGWSETPPLQPTGCTHAPVMRWSVLLCSPGLAVAFLGLPDPQSFHRPVMPLDYSSSAGSGFLFFSLPALREDTR
jgi:hypothetical protein